MQTPVRKVGRITVAVGLMALGAALLMDNLLAAGYTSLVLRFWPVLLIGFGLEYILFSLIDPPDEAYPVRLRFDLGGALLLFFIVGLTAGFQSIGRLLPNPADYAFVGGPTSSNRTETDAIDAEGAQEVVVEVEMGRVELYPQRLTEVRVEASYSTHGILLLRDEADAVNDFDLDLDEDGSTVTVTARAPDGINLASVTATYKVYVPDGLTVKVRTGAGSIQVRDYDGDLTLNAKLGTIQVAASSGKLEAETSSGTIQIMHHTGPVVAKTSAGGISVDRVNGSLQLDSGTGVIRVNHYTGGRLVAETKTGAIHVATPAPLEGDVLLKTSAGSIHLTVPQDSSMKVTAQTKTGSIQAPDFVTISRNGPSQSGVGITGDGKHTVTLEATLGSIYFNTP